VHILELLAAATYHVYPADRGPWSHTGLNEEQAGGCVGCCQSYAFPVELTVVARPSSPDAAPSQSRAATAQGVVHREGRPH
jgi:hypothetical protein